MAFDVAGTRTSRVSLLAGIGIVVAAVSTLTTPANAHHWRGRGAYVHHAHSAYATYANRRIVYHAYAPPPQQQFAAVREPAFAAVVVDENTGRTLYSASENEPRHPASLTKVMTLFLLFEQLDKGRISLDTPITMSAHAASQAPSKLGLEPGGTITVENAIKAIVTRSANDVAVAVAEAIGGDEADFAQMMTRKAHALGMTRTAYVNASGLPDDRQITTAHDLSILGRAVEERFPRYFRYFSIQSFDYAGEVIGNHDHLLGRVDGVDGIKTGYTRASGFNLLTSVHRNGRSLVAVVMGGPTAATRDRFMESLIAEHIASASPVRSATMIADASAPAAAEPPAPPVRTAFLAPASIETPEQPTRGLASRPRLEPESDSADAEGDSDALEASAPAEVAPERPSSRREAYAPPAAAIVPIAAPAAAERVEVKPAAHGWVKGPDAVTPAPRVRELQASLSPRDAANAPDSPAATAALKAAMLAKALAASATPPTPPVREQQASAAARGWVRGPDGVAATPASAPVRVAAADPAALGWVRGPEGHEPKASAREREEETHVAQSRESAPPARLGWMIQIGASDNVAKVNDLLIRAKAQNRLALASAKPFTEKVEKGDGAVYRARFAGLDSSTTAAAACKLLKRQGFPCFTTHD
jgi:D-alanyl-D-alanine carboxypeptidase